MKRPKVTWRRLLIALVAAVVLYTAGGFLGVPLLVKHAILPGLSDQGWLNGTASAESVSCNPFTLRLSLTGFELSDDQGDPLVSCGKVVANASIKTLWEAGYRLDELRLEQPHVNITVEENPEKKREVNLDEMLEFEVLGDMIMGLPRVAVDRLAVIEGSAEYHDTSLEEPLHQEARSLTFAIDGFDTNPDNLNANRFTGELGTGGRIAWQGQTKLDPLTASGTLELTELDLSHYTPYYEGAIAARALDGRLTTKVTYEFAPLADEPVIRAVIEHVKLDDVAATGRGAYRWHVTADELTTGKIVADLIAASITLDSVKLERPVAVVLAERIEIEGEIAAAAEQPDTTKTQAPGPDDDSGETKPAPIEMGEAPPVTDDKPEATSTEEAPAENLLLRLDPPGGWNITLGQLAIADADVLLTEQLPEGPVRREQTLESVPEGLVRLASLGRLGLAETKLGTKPIAASVEKVEVNEPALFVTIDPDRMTLVPKRIGDPLRERATQASGAATPDADGIPLATIEQIVLDGGRVEAHDLSLDQAAKLIITDAAGTIQNVATSGGEDVNLDLKATVGSGKGAVSGTVNPFPDTRSANLKLQLDAMALESVDGYFRRFLGHELDSGGLGYTGHYTLQGTKITGQNEIILNDFHLGKESKSEDALDLPVKLGLSLLREPSGRIKLDVPVEGDTSDPEFRVGGLVVTALTNTFSRVATAPFQFIASSFGEEGQDLSRVSFEPGLAEPVSGSDKILKTLAKALTERPALTLVISGLCDPSVDATELRRIALRDAIKLEVAESLPASDPLRETPDRIVLTEEVYRKAIVSRFNTLMAEAEAADQPVETDGDQNKAEKPKGKLNIPILSDVGREIDDILDGENGGDKEVAEGVTFADAEAKVIAAVEVPDSSFESLANERAAVIHKALMDREIDENRLVIEPPPEDTAPAATVVFDLR